MLETSWYTSARGPRTPRDATPIVRTTLTGTRVPLSALSTPQILRRLTEHLADRHQLTTVDLLTLRTGLCPELRAILYAIATELLGLDARTVHRHVATGHYLDNPTRDHATHAQRMADASMTWYHAEVRELERFIEASA